MLNVLRRWLARTAAIFVTLVLMSGPAALAGEARIAVAANFTAAAKMIGLHFSKQTGHRIQFSFGSTGQLYAQISQSAPYDAFLSADQQTPRKAVKQGFAIAASAFTYARGRLALYSRNETLVKGPEILRSGAFSRIAIANPVTAPYGAAALEAMQKLGVAKQLANKIVRGNNIAQTFQFVQTGNAELGFVALAQISSMEGGSRWIVPDGLHTPVLQDAVLLQRGEKNPAARAFLDFLKGPDGQAIIARAGYDTGPSNTGASDSGTPNSGKP